jgi:hypothetical protein
MVPNFLTHHKHIFIPEYTVYIFCTWPDNGFLKKPIQLACTASLCLIDMLTGPHLLNFLYNVKI